MKGKGHKWTEGEKAFLRKVTPGRSHREIFELCRKEFDWEIPDVETIKGAIHRYHLNTGRTGRFVKGQKAHNKGQKLTAEIYAKAEPTMFRKGNLPHNTHPVGKERMTKDGYIRVKVSDDRTVPSRKNWKFKHHLIYEAEHGPIPEGHTVTFLDGDKSNFSLENLVCIPREINLRMNQSDLYSTDPHLTKSGIRLAELKAVISKKIKEGGN